MAVPSTMYPSTDEDAGRPAGQAQCGFPHIDRADIPVSQNRCQELFALHWLTHTCAIRGGTARMQVTANSPDTPCRVEGYNYNLSRCYPRRMADFCRRDMLFSVSGSPNSSPILSGDGLDEEQGESLQHHSCFLQQMNYLRPPSFSRSGFSRSSYSH